jgi:hypothetical protein
MRDPYVPTWWSQTRPYAGFYPRRPPVDLTGVLKSLTLPKSEDEWIEAHQQGDGWRPAQTHRWMNVVTMLETIVGELLVHLADQRRFPVLPWDSRPKGWWHAWTPSRNHALKVVRFQVHQLLLLCSLVSYLCAITRFESGRGDSWFEILLNSASGNNQSVIQWFRDFRHTWVPQFELTRRVGTFFDARDIKQWDILQLHLDSNVPFIIYWGKDPEAVPGIQCGIIPDELRPNAASIATARRPRAPPLVSSASAAATQGMSLFILYIGAED